MDSKNLTVTACSTDTKALAAIGRMFFDLAGESNTQLVLPGIIMNAAPVDRETPCISASLAPTLTPESNELLRPVDAFTPAPVDTAAVFGGTVQPALTATVENALAEAFTPTAPVAVPAPPVAFVAPAPPVAFVAPAPPVMVSAPTLVTLDKSGLPWDSRINTSNKTQTAKGIWKRAPGLSDELYQGVLTELRSVMAAPAPAAVVPAPPVAPVAPTPPAPPVDMSPAADPWTAENQAAAAPAPPAPPVAVAPTPPVPTDAPASYAQLLGVVAQRIQGGGITHAEVTGACVAAGLPDLNSAAARPDLIPSIYAGMVAIWSTRA